jgi:hypothetical protein
MSMVLHAQGRKGDSALQRLENDSILRRRPCLCLIAIAAWPRTATLSNDNDAEDGDSDNDSDEEEGGK